VELSLPAALTKYLDDYGGSDGLYSTAVEGLVIFKASRLEMPNHVIYRPSLCIVAQGAKQVVIGGQVFQYSQGQALVVGVELPAFGQVTQASIETPYLAIAVEFDVQILRQVMGELDQPPKPSAKRGLSVFVDDFDGPIMDCFVRLVNLLANPRAVPILYPAIMREICYWLLTGGHGDEVCKLAVCDSHTQRIADAIYILRDNYSRSVRIEELANAARMSTSSFHQHFKSLTSMTPLQYQKHLRLVVARRLLTADGVYVASAAYKVGYESVSQFSREYTRMFGVAPKRDALNMKGVAC
jgi:AraC-like DNA-binding protein